MSVNLFNKYKSFILNILFILILVILINGRSLLGLYIFGFRLGEILTGFSILLLSVIIYKNKFLETILVQNLFTVTYYWFLILLFIILSIQQIF